MRWTRCKNFYQQLQTGHIPNVAGNLGTIHPQLARLQFVGLNLLISDLLEGLLDQILPRLLHVLRDPTPKVVYTAHIKVTIPQLVNPQRIPYLDIEEKFIMHLFIAPPKARFERFQSNQHIYGHVGS